MAEAEILARTAHFELKQNEKLDSTFYLGSESPPRYKAPISRPGMIRTKRPIIQMLYRLPTTSWRLPCGHSCSGEDVCPNCDAGGTRSPSRGDSEGRTVSRVPRALCRGFLGHSPDVRGWGGKWGGVWVVGTGLPLVFSQTLWVSGGFPAWGSA